jgi:hypothetical protein
MGSGLRLGTRPVPVPKSTDIRRHIPTSARRELWQDGCEPSGYHEGHASAQARGCQIAYRRFERIAVASRVDSRIGPISRC